MIRSGIVIGMKPDEIRDLLPRDVWLCFEGWNAAHEGPKPGADAPSRDEYQDLVRRVDGDHG